MVFCVPQIAGAHSGLTEESVPGPSATVDSLSEIRLVFADPIEDDSGNAIELSTIDDRFVELGPVEVADATTLRAEVRGAYPDTGEYLLFYTVASTDGDGLQEGGFVFIYDGPVERSWFVYAGSFAGSRWPAVLVGVAVALALVAGVLLVLRRRA